MSDNGLGSWPAKRRQKSGTDVAISFEGADTDYATFADRVDRLAGALDARGIRQGDRGAYLGDNHPSFLETLFAAARLGAIFVPVNTRLAAAEVRFALEDSGSSILVHADSHTAIAEAATSIPRIVVEGDYEQALSAATPFTDERDVGLDDGAMILYTSGTTGQPKGALLTHGNLTWNSFNVLVDYDLVSTDRALMVSPLFHVASLGMGTLPAILKGATVVLERRFDPERVLALIESKRITWMSGVPTTFQMLCESPSWDTTDLSSLGKLTCGGSPVPLRVLDAYEKRGLAFTGGYGMTESSPGVTSLRPSASRTKAGSAGLPHFFTDIRLAAAEGDEFGEIQVRGPNVMKEYWNRPEATALSHDGDWFRSGDLGFLDPDGYLFIADRLKDMIISGGENVYPAEVELLLDELPELVESAVIGVPDEKWGEVPLAVVVLRDGADAAGLDERIQAHLDGRLARYKIPKRTVVTDALPRTASGKVVKAALRSKFTEQ